MRNTISAPLGLLFAALLVLAVTGCASDKPMPGSTVGSFMDDSYLTSAVKTKLLGDTGLKAFHIHVVTKDRIVTLTGALPTTALRDEAVRTAKSVDGVKDVVSEIEIKSE
ncbi:MAG TPA: BON domain-containing protein [Gammaproteobacteria bacterium]|nr:BON domain-containing protein [Gammaproteobacteria bacterium]